MVEYQYPNRAASYYTRDALLFANSIGVTSDELHFLYVRPPTLDEPLRLTLVKGTGLQLPSLSNISYSPR